MVVSCDLDLDPTTFIYEHDVYPVKIYRYTNNELSKSPAFESNRIADIETNRQTDATEAITCTTPPGEC